MEEKYDKILYGYSFDEYQKLEFSNNLLTRLTYREF